MKTLFWNTSPLRAVGEATAAAALVGLLLRVEQNVLLSAFAYLWLSAACGLWAAWRARLNPGRCRLLLEVALALAVNSILQGIGALFFGWALLAEIAQQPALLVSMAGTVGAFTLLFFMLRTAMFLWQRWQQFRQQRLVWSLVHAQVLTILVVGGVLALREAAMTVLTLEVVGASSSSQALVALVTLLTPLLFFAVVLTPVAAVLLLLAGGMAYIMARPITTRVEQLAQMTGAFTRGSMRCACRCRGRMKSRSFSVTLTRWRRRWKPPWTRSRRSAIPCRR